MSRRFGLLMPAVVLAAIAGSPVVAQQAPPTYVLQFLGPGVPVAINNLGTVVGSRLVNGSSYQPLVSVGGASWTVLPTPAGADSVFPTDVNDGGVIVGVAYTAWNAEAVRWRPSSSGYTVQKLPKLPGDTSSYATAINNVGQIVGARRALGYVPASTTGWLYSDTGGMVDLFGRYGWAVWPSDVNDVGQLIAGIERLDLATGVIDAIGNGPANYNPVGAIAINNAGQIAGTASLRSSSLNIISAFRFDPATGWMFIAGSSRYTGVSSINARGDTGYSEQGPAVYFDGLGLYGFGSLLDANVRNSGWIVTGNGVEINDDRVIATVGRNPITGESGGVLLLPSGTLQPPAPPQLAGVAHPATPDAPWNAISLTWTASAGATSYLVERKTSSDPAYTLLTPGSGTIQLKYDDTAVLAQTPYTYRVFALGPGGRSLPSNEVAAVAPGRETVPPVVTIVSPVFNASVSGIVRVQAAAADNVGVTRMEIRTTGGRLLKSVSGASLNYDWNTTGLRRGSTQSLIVVAYDAASNLGTARVSVRIAR